MKAYSRRHPGFSLCGLNCALCPRFRTDGSSKCPGCGGEDFADKHPACAVVSCMRRHGDFEFCFECPDYPCPKYAGPNEADSFISYRNVVADLAAANADLGGYLAALAERSAILSALLADYNDGRSKALFCTAANLLSLPALKGALDRIGAEARGLDAKGRARLAGEALRAEAAAEGIELALRT
jgi:hypothetical protein